jgi:hypothetical protein
MGTMIDTQRMEVAALEIKRAQTIESLLTRHIKWARPLTVLRPLERDPSRTHMR